MTNDLEIIVSIRFTDEECKCELNPHEITELLGIQPTSSWKKGEIFSKWPVQAQINGWELESGLPRTADVDGHLNALKEKIGQATNKVVKLAQQWNAYINYVHYVKGYGSAVVLDKKWIKWSGDLGFGIVVDTYSVEDEEEKM